MEHIKEKWVVIDSGGRVMLKAVGEPQIVCTLETKPLKITREIQARAALIAAAPNLLEACKAWVVYLDGNLSEAESVLLLQTKEAITKAEGQV